MTVIANFFVIVLYPSFVTACPDEYREGVSCFEFVTLFIKSNNKESSGMISFTVSLKTIDH